MYAAKEAGRNCACWHDGRAIHPVGGDERPAAEQPAADFPAANPPAQAAAARVGERRKGMADRSEFSLVLGRRLAERRRGGEPPAVALVRIDDYPGIVMRHGRQAGLMVLRATAQFLAAAVREMDMVAEYDETTFTLLLPGADLGSVVRICERVARRSPAANCPPPPEGSSFTVSVSGVVTQKSDETQMLLCAWKRPSIPPSRPAETPASSTPARRARLSPRPCGRCRSPSPNPRFSPPRDVARQCAATNLRSAPGLQQ